MVLQEIDDDLDTHAFWNSVLSHSNDEVVQKKRFIMRMANALHGAGNFSFRTEKAIEHIAHAFGLRALLILNPVSASLSFQSIEEGVVSTENYHFRVTGGLSASKLAALDMLCHEIIEQEITFLSAENTLYDLEVAKHVHSWWVTALAYGSSAATVTVVIFGGSWLDGFYSFVFGEITYAISVMCQLFVGMAEVECFISSFTVAFLTSFFDRGDSCLFGQMFGSLSWLFPGLSIAIALLEVYSQMIVIGSSRLVHSIFTAMQLGFGLQLGYMVVSRTHSSPLTFKTGCLNPIPVGTGFILLPIMAMSFAILIDAKWSQMPGAVFTCICGYTCSYWSSQIFAAEIAPFLAAIAMTFGARFFAYFNHQERPLVYIIVGLFMLVPGGVAVKGMSNMWAGDVISGMTFTFQMLLVGVCLAIGVFMALLPKKNYLKYQGRSSLSLHNPLIPSRPSSTQLPSLVQLASGDSMRSESDPSNILLDKGNKVGNYSAV